MNNATNFLTSHLRRREQEGPRFVFVPLSMCRNTSRMLFVLVLRHDAWTPEVCSQKSTAETESIARQRLVKTHFQDNQLEQSVAEQR
jgi:hypothetical protein